VNVDFMTGCSKVSGAEASRPVWCRTATRKD